MNNKVGTRTYDLVTIPFCNDIAREEFPCTYSFLSATCYTTIITYRKYNTETYTDNTCQLRARNTAARLSNDEQVGTYIIVVLKI